MEPRVYCQSKFFFSLVKASQSIHHHGRLGVILKTSVIPDSLSIDNKQLYHACISCLISPKVLPCERFGFLAIFDKTSQLAIAYHVLHESYKQDCILVYCERHGILSYPLLRNVTVVMHHRGKSKLFLFRFFHQGEFLGGFSTTKKKP